MKGKQALPGQVADQQCGGKFCYISEDLALEALKSIREHRGFRKHHKEKRVYQCPSCHFWHITSLSIEGKQGFQSQSKDKKRAIQGIKSTLTGSLPADEAFVVLQRMNADRIAGKDVRRANSYVREVKEEEAKKKSAKKKSGKKASWKSSKKQTKKQTKKPSGASR